MEWRDEGVVVSVRAHGETSAIAEILTADHGRWMGMVKGGRSRQQRPVLQPGNLVMVTWRARLEDHLGLFQLEPLSLKAGTRIWTRFRLGLGDEDLNLLCGVIWSTPAGGHDHTYGLRFIMSPGINRPSGPSRPQGP